jgi:outer membrane protein OmpA-like peptidoglycan-associated protein
MPQTSARARMGAIVRMESRIGRCTANDTDSIRLGSHYLLGLWYSIIMKNGLFGLVCFALVGSSARAQEVVAEFDAQNVRPSIDARRTLLTDDAGLAVSNTFMGKVVFGQAKDLLTFTRNRDGKEMAVIKDLMTADMILGYTVSRFRMGLDVPIVLSATSDIADTQGGIGDVALDFRGTVMNPEENPVGFAVAARFGTPTATVDLPIGGSGIGYETTFILDKRMGPLLAAMNLGYRGRPPAELDNITIDDQVVTRFGVGYEFSGKVGMSGDVAGYLQPTALDNQASGAWEGLVGGWYRPGNWIVRMGVGAGLSQGIGTSAYRSMLSVGYEPEPIIDTDGDGLLDRSDPCPDEPEDIDGFEDSDGCPDELNPVRILFRDPYGYPIDDLIANLENEDDGTVAEGSAKFAQNLTPGVWIVTASAEGFDFFEDDFTVAEGQSLDRVFVLNPKAPPPQVRVTRKAIRITDKIYFDTNAATIMETSHRLLNAVAETLGNHPEVTRLRVEGHTDSRSSDSYNMKLSQSRADAVRTYLINQGVSGERLVAAGKGEREPLDARETPDAWDLNRRVEFMIEERSE